ncbi:hypothetical protein VCHA31O73_360022 [Vibrio chagasii]|nr:hypothetical protein VCHA31O73_360022 [Vibrio chagasii]
MQLPEFIKSIGVNVISEDLGYGKTTVSSWYHLQKAPRPHAAKKLIEYSKGSLTWESIYLPYVTNKKT